MDLRTLGDLRDGDAHFGFERLRLFVGEVDGVEVSGQRHAERVCDFVFDGVEHGVGSERAHTRVHFYMYGGERRAFAVAINAQVVHTEHAVRFGHDSDYLLRQRGVGGFPEQFGACLGEYLHALPDDEQRDGGARPAVGGQRGELHYDPPDRRGGGGRAVAQTVDGGGFKRFGVQF